MSQVSTTNIHHVVSVTAQTRHFDNFVSQEYTFTLADGSVVSVAAFSAEPLQAVQLMPRDPRKGVPA